MTYLVTQHHLELFFLSCIHLIQYLPSLRLADPCQFSEFNKFYTTSWFKKHVSYSILYI